MSPLTAEWPGHDDPYDRWRDDRDMFDEPEPADYYPEPVDLAAEAYDQWLDEMVDREASITAVDPVAR